MQRDEMLKSVWAAFCKDWWEGACALFVAGYALGLAIFASALFTGVVMALWRLFQPGGGPSSLQLFILAMLPLGPYCLGKYYGLSGRIPMSEIEREAIRRAFAKKLLFPNLTGNSEPPAHE